MKINGNSDGGGGGVITTLTATNNGTYSAPSGVDGYNPVTVALPLEDYATKQWVEDKGYITTEDSSFTSLVEEVGELQDELITTTTKYDANKAYFVDVDSLLDNPQTNINTDKSLFIRGGEIYLWASALTTKIYKFNKQTYEFEFFLNASRTTSSQVAFWVDPVGEVFVFANGQESCHLNMTTGVLTEWYPPVDVYVNTLCCTNIVKAGNTWFLIPEGNAEVNAYPYIPGDPELGTLGHFDDVNTVYFTSPNSDWYKYFGVYDGVTVMKYDNKLYDLVYNPINVTLAFVEEVTQRWPEYNGSLPDPRWVRQVDDYLIFPQSNGVILKLINGVWTDLQVDYTNQPNNKRSGCGVVWYSGEMLFGYSINNTTPIPMCTLSIINLGSAKQITVSVIDTIQTEISAIQAVLGNAVTITNNILS